MAVSTEEWQEQEREIINEFFKVKVPQALKHVTLVCTEKSCIEFGKRAIDAEDLERVHNQGL
jgi:hypothetical protein